MEEACACYDDLNPDQRRAFALIMQASPLMRSTGANELHVLCAMHQRFGPPSQASVVQPLVEGAVGGGAGGQQGGITHGAPRRRGMVVGGRGKGGGVAPMLPRTRTATSRAPSLGAHRTPGRAMPSRRPKHAAPSTYTYCCAKRSGDAFSPAPRRAASSSAQKTTTLGSFAHLTSHTSRT